MIFKILFWSMVVYIGIIILWRLFVSIVIIIKGCPEGGVKGVGVGILEAFAANLLMILGDIWGLAKYAIGALILLLIIRSCSH